MTHDGRRQEIRIRTYDETLSLRFRAAVQKSSSREEIQP
jgi:hypothetical protein